MAKFVSALVSTISSEKELIILQQLNTSLARHQQSDEGSFLPFLDGDEEFPGIGDNPFPGVTPSDICSSEQFLNQFTCYLFDRRFGWSETDTEGGRRVRKLSSTGATLSAGSGQQKTVLNTQLDCLIKWYLHQEISIPLLSAFRYTITQTQNMPVVRNRAVIHVMDWFKNQSAQLCDQSFFPLTKEVLMLSLTDIWSAIRNACASRLGPVASYFNIEHVESLFNSLVKVCCNESSWQAKEGAIMGMNALLQRFMSRMSSKSPMSSPRTLEQESEASPVKRIPEFISKQIQPVVFQLLFNSQLTIREHAAKTLATYITCSSINDALSVFNDVISILKNGSESQLENAQGDGRFLDDYASEGFLGVCIFLVKVLPLSYLLPGWPDYISTFMLYISHPASTVRQATSTVFKYLVVKSSHSVIVLKLLLQALAMGWKPDTDAMTTEISQNLTSGSPLPSVCDNSDVPLSDTWEGREGRLLTYELIFKYLIKNHWLYTFGPAGSGIQGEEKNSRDSSESSSRQSGETEDRHRDMGLHKQLSTQDRPMHHVESEKSLAVRFLTQADLYDLDKNTRTTVSERMMTVVEESDKTPVTVPQGGSKVNGPCQFDTTSSLLMQAQLVDMYLAELITITDYDYPRPACQFDTTSSLLMQAQLVDMYLTEGENGENEQCRQEKQLQSLKKILEKRRNSKVQCAYSWIESEEVQDMSRILKVILYQTAESLGSPQWELRRIANQVLPCLAEVIRWYDINLLVSVWNSYLIPVVPTCLMTYTAALLLKESVIHAVKLVPLLHKPPHSWQDLAKCRECLSSITTTVQSQLPQYLPHLQSLLQRNCYDRLSIIAADIILMSHTHFSLSREKQLSQYSTIVKFLKSLFHFAHPKTRISAELLTDKLSDMFISPFEGYMSCCLVKPDNKTQCARQVEKQFITEIHHHLPALLQNLPMSEFIPVAPILAHYIGLFIEDSHTSKAACECLVLLSGEIVRHTDTQTDRDIKHQYLKCILLTLKELSAVIAMKSLDLHQIQRVLTIYEELSKCINILVHLRIALSGIAARLNETVNFSVDTAHHDIIVDDLFLLSNDIPRSHSPEIEEDSDSEELVVGTPSKNRFPESLTLNLSNNLISSPEWKTHKECRPTTGFQRALLNLSNSFICFVSPGTPSNNRFPESLTLNLSNSLIYSVSPGTPSNNRFPESLTLNLSNNSGSLTGRLSSLSIHSSEAGGDRETEGSDTEEGSSDWDSWDEEEEGQSVFCDVFSEFLKKLQKSSKIGQSEFRAEVDKLGDKEKSVILGLLKT